MNSKPTTWAFWVVGGLGLLWNLMGSINFMMQIQTNELATMPEPFHTIVANRPTWATVAFALGVFAGTLGCVLLLLKRQEAFYVLLASLAGIVVHLLPYISGANLPAGFGIGNTLLVFVAPLLVGIFLLWFARKNVNVEA